MLQLIEVVAGYGAIEVLHRLSLEVPRGKIVALLGGNGAGKSTTLRAIAGLGAIKGGRIVFDGATLAGLPAHRIARRGIALVPQGRELFPDMTIRDNLVLGARDTCSKDARLKLLEQVFDLFPRLRERLAQQAGTLSGGEQAMLATARAIMSEPSLLLLDEPTAGLAPLVVKELAAALARLKQAGQTILLVEQNIRMALDLADYVYVIRGGVIVAQDQATAFTDSDEMFRSYFG